MVAPGEYLITEPIALHDVKLRGEGEAGSSSGVRFVVDAYANDFGGGYAFTVSGNVSIDNVEFTGFSFADFAQPSTLAYIGSGTPSTDVERNRITIENSRFISGWQTGFSSVWISNFAATPDMSPRTDLKSTNNYLEGTTYQLFVGNPYSQSPDALITANVTGNEFRFAANGILVLGAASGDGGTITARSSKMCSTRPGVTV